MALIADGLLLIAAMTAAAYCIVLSRRLSRLSGLDKGLGKAIVDLSERVDAMNAALAGAKTANESAARDLRAALRDALAAEARLKAQIEAAKKPPVAETAPAEAVLEPGEQSEEMRPAPAPMPAGPEYGAVSAPAHDEVARTADDPLRETMNVIDRAPPGEEDQAFASRLVDALSALQTKPGARP